VEEVVEGGREGRDDDVPQARRRVMYLQLKSVKESVKEDVKAATMM
jgi:hypothetical protein